MDLPRLVSLEVDECYFPPDGFPLALCLTQLTNLRLVGGRCTRLPPGISQLQCLQVGGIGAGMGLGGAPQLAAVSPPRSLLECRSCACPPLMPCVDQPAQPQPTVHAHPSIPPAAGAGH